MDVCTSDDGLYSRKHWMVSLATSKISIIFQAQLWIETIREKKKQQNSLTGN